MFKPKNRLYKILNVLYEVKPTLEILAAGRGSRYGGSKQIDTFIPEGLPLLIFQCMMYLKLALENFYL